MIHWIQSLFIYDPGNPLMMGTIPFALMFMVFLALYVVIKHYSRTAMMVYVIAFSLFFAYKANGLLMILLPITALVNYMVTEKMRQEDDDKSARRKGWLTVTVVMDLALLGYYKYTNFIIGDVLNEMLHTNFSLQSIALPIGISFYTFQAISYAVDVYRHRFNMEVSLVEYCFYITFFPLLLAGPITRAKNLIPALKHNGQASETMIWRGLFLIMMGLIKKNVLSDYIAQFDNWVFDAPETFSGFENLMAAMGYTVQIFLDFSGYSDMSIGVASIMGFALPDNFWFPYRAMNLTDFWRRWHISLSTWFRDYVYIPLGGNRKGTLRMHLNNFITMLVAGLWHGASWMFVIWGGMHGMGLVIHKVFRRTWNMQMPRWANPISWLMTYTYVTIAWSFFRAKNLTVLGQLYHTIWQDFSMDYLGPFLAARTMWAVFVTATMVSYLIPERWYMRSMAFFIRLPWMVKLVLFFCCIQLVIETSQSSVQPFIYYQF